MKGLLEGIVIFVTGAGDGVGLSKIHHTGHVVLQRPIQLHCAVCLHAQGQRHSNRHA